MAVREFILAKWSPRDLHLVTQEREADMEHEILLMDADFKVVVRMTARRKHAGMAEEAMHRPRKADYSCSTQDTSPILNESE